MKLRYAGVLAGVVVAIGLAVPAAYAQSRQQVVKIPVQHIDVRILAAVMGAPAIPNEAELAQGRLQGGGQSYGYGGFPNRGNYGNQAYTGLSSTRFAPAAPAGYGQNGYGQNLYGSSINSRAPWFTQSSPQFTVPQPGMVADPRTNSLLGGP